MVQNWSSYQLDIFNKIENGNSNIVVNAVAGSGKTTTIVEACKRLNKPSEKVQFLAFNKSIATELKTKLSGYACVNTLHSFGYSILTKLFNTSRYHKVFTNNNKYFKYLQKNIFDMSSCINREMDNITIFNACKTVKKIFDLARVNLIEYEDINSLERLCDIYNIFPKYDEIYVANELLKNAYTMPSDLVIDFTDMIVLPLAYRKHIPTFDYVFIDECQDLNTAQRTLMLCAAKGGRFIAVGDRNQAINGFCGADCTSFDSICKLPNTIELPLSVNYRCGTNILKLAQEIVPQIQPCNNAISGDIEHYTTLSRSLFHKGDMVLCRKTAPLVSLCFKLLENGITAVIKGSDIAEAMKEIIKRANVSSMQELKTWIQSEKNSMAKEIADYLKVSVDVAKKTKKYVILSDRLNCIENMCVNSVSNVSDIKSYIDRMFDEKNVKNAVVLSTAHKSKGLESDRVILMIPNQFPLTFKNKKQKPWELEQEMNLKYVAITRAKKELIMLDMNENEIKDAKITD